MKITETFLNGVFVIEPQVFEDDRGFFFEAFNSKKFQSTIGEYNFVQDNHSKSSKGVLRGLHFQHQHSQGKLVRVSAGSVFDVAVDIRKDSPTWGKWFGVTLSAENKKQLWVPPGFAHGFLTLEDNTEFLYKCTDFYYPQYEKTITWDDIDINIKWPDLDSPYTLSDKDLNGQPLKDTEAPS